MATVLPWASLAITVKIKTLPAVVLLGAVMTKWVAGALTVIVVVLPVTVMAAASKTEMVWLPKVFRVALKVPVPPVRVELTGKRALLSVLVKRSVAE